MRSGNKELRQGSMVKKHRTYPSIQFTRGYRICGRLTLAPAGMGMTSSAGGQEGVDGLLHWSSG